ncbi:hypothetical protein [Prosthecomicrobium sp. N25]|uniref:hypothetical protein n=1 Tax=Prosthecomicrobium sp. N25 TaxID=3129254 RepID=UPI003077ECC4
MDLAPPPPAVVIQMDPGGRIDSRMQEIARLRANGTRVVIDGYCASACTMYLMLSGQICATKRAVLAFHAPYRCRTGGAPCPEDLKVFDPAVTYAQLRSSPAPVQRWILARGGLTAQNLTMPNRDVLRFVPLCGA